MRKNLGFYLLSGAICAAGGMQANAVTINGYDFDLSQFDGATVTTSYHHDGHIHGNTWDNLVGVDHYTLGELATAQYGFDPGDHISLGDYSAQDSFTLTYGTGSYMSPADGNRANRIPDELVGISVSMVAIGSPPVPRTAFRCTQNSRRVTDRSYSTLPNMVSVSESKSPRYPSEITLAWVPTLHLRPTRAQALRSPRSLNRVALPYWALGCWEWPFAVAETARHKLV
jgi:hypothetical protein